MADDRRRSHRVTVAVTTGPRITDPIPEVLTTEGLCAVLSRSGEADPDWWHPNRRGEVAALPAKRICSMCPVKIVCLTYAKSRAGKITGIWGGVSFGGWRNPRGSSRGENSELDEDPPLGVEVLAAVKDNGVEH